MDTLKNKEKTLFENNVIKTMPTFTELNVCWHQLFDDIYPQSQFASMY